MRRVYFVVAVCILPTLLLYFSCGKETAEDKPKENTEEESVDDPIYSTGNVAIATVDKILQVVDPVQAYPVSDTSPEAIEARAFGQLAIATELTTVANTGVSLGRTTSDIASAFGNASGSKAFCDSVNRGMKFFKEASAPDFSLCALKLGAKKEQFAVKDDGLNGNAIDSGVQKIWDFKIKSSEGSQTFRMKFQIDVDEKGGLKSFENFSCTAQGDAKLSQEGYAKQTITDGKVKVHARSFGNKGDGFKMRVEMEGALDSKGKLVGLKKIDYAEKLEDRFVHAKVTQSTDNIEIIGYESTGSVTQYISFIELLDKNTESSPYAVTKLAYGDGASLLKVTQNSTSTNISQGWNGDTLVVNASEPRLAKVTGREADYLAPENDDLDLEFPAAETYDCSGAADYTVDGSMEDFKECIEAFEIDQEGSQMCTDLTY
jgi:hypothetical protein